MSWTESSEDAPDRRRIHGGGTAAARSRSAGHPNLAPMTTPSTVRSLVDHLARAGGSPRLTWYDVDGERVELSGAVLANWVVKTTNLLVEELDVGPGTTVALDLPAHWRSVTWAMAAWTAGACVAVGAAGPDDADVVVTDAPDRHTGAREVVAVSLAALARRFDGDLPPGAVDAAAAVMTYGDVLGWVPDVDPHAPALTVRDGGAPGASGTVPGGPGGPGTQSGQSGAVDHAGLLAWARDASTAPEGGRVAVLAGPDRGADLVGALRTVLAVLDRSGSVVLVGAGLAAARGQDPARFAAMLATEKVTVTEPGDAG
jgi:uncharacterized protein (TIGR03089 family)